MDEEIKKMLKLLIDNNTISYYCNRCNTTWKTIKTNKKPSRCKKCNSIVWDRPKRI